MSFGWLGTFRQGSWQAFRKFVLEERRDVLARMKVIRAELARIGEVTVLFATEVDDDGNVTGTSEERLGFTVTPGSSLGKLIQVYTALGGNPFDISLFLTPDSAVAVDPADLGEATSGQPHEGVIYPRSGAYSTGSIYEGGFLVLKKYTPARVGGRKDMDNSKFASRVDLARRWVNKEIRYKRNDLEARIIKLCDLREQLLHELEQLEVAVAGFDDMFPDIDETRIDDELTVARLVESIDAVFYPMDETNTPDFNTENTEALGPYPFLLSDISPDEDNTAL